MALSREMMGAAVQMLGRVPTAQELQDPQLMQRIMHAADPTIQDGAAFRQNLSWVDELMAPAPAVDTPAAQKAPMKQSRAPSSKGDRLDAQEAPLPPRRPSDLGGDESTNKQTPLPPRRPAEFGGREESVSPPVNEVGDSQQWWQKQGRRRRKRCCVDARSPFIVKLARLCV